MGINVYEARSQANQLGQYANSLRDVKNRLEHYQSSINDSWKSEEMIYVNRAIQQINSELNSITSTLYSLEHKVDSAAYQIKCEEEARAAALSRKND
ncbi:MULTISPECIES: hypothetical protein [Pontibacillus]|uniref:WXG100 family type VII secretion target n=1 Tax=Pontibacillus chungwhensis TaxID=265426 RepID=A0ABY8UZE2_9BACI|nr:MULTISPECIES: hypothetical protein [Pontibacillus]MCD5324193.1 hypothetical protein [Pontibacillus sp. HN14]WIF97749.1 hypothetical protein QNI29_18800 [Pontibacillus chungwhensis]